MSEAISDALGRAQTLSFTIFSAALIIAVLIQTSVSENRNALERLNSEFAAVSTISSHSDTVIREIRKYILTRLPSDMAEEEALRKIRHAFFNAVGTARKVSDGLVKTGRRDLFDVIGKVNVELVALRQVSEAPVSINVDLSPQSIILLAHLEDLRLRDLVVLAHLVSVDPIALDKTLTEYWGRLALMPESADMKKLASDLADELATDNRRRDTAAFSNVGHYATSLRTACETFGAQFSPLVPGGLFSSFSSVQAKLIDLDQMRGPISDKLSGDFQIAVPIIDQALPVSFVTLLFPFGLIGGYGLINTALLFARRKIRNLNSDTDRKAAADAGYLFDQLLVGTVRNRFMNLLLLLSLIFLPWIASAWLAVYFGDGQSTLIKAIATGFLVPGFLFALSIIDAAYEVSGFAGD